MSSGSGKVTAAVNPFVGPRSFQTDETLFGRDRETRELFGLLAAERIVLLHSPSGAGKTSLVQAALIPKLKAEGFFVRPIIRVNADPTEAERGHEVSNSHLFSVVRSLEAGLPVGYAQPAAAAIEASLQAILKERVCEDTEDEVLIFDQFEEILTSAPNDLEAKWQFFQQIGSILRSPRLYALFSIREEYVAALDPYLARIPGGLDTRYRLELLGRDAALEAILRPAEGTDLPITEGAARILVDDLRMTRVRRRGAVVDEPGPYVEPVQLQVVCYRLWEENRGKAGIDEASVRGQGGDVDSALAGYYADRIAVIRDATGVGERALRDWCEHRLITSQGTRGQVQSDDPAVQGLPDHAVAALVDARLVRAEERRGSTWYELTHDRMIDPIRKNNQRWRTIAMEPWQRAATLWEQGDEPRDLLLRGWALSRVLRRARKAPPGEITTSEARFLEACRMARRWRRISGLVGTAFLLILAISGGTGWFLWRVYWTGREQTTSLTRKNEDKDRQLHLEQALASCRGGDVGRGLLLLTQALGSVPAEDDDLRRAIKSQIVAWLPKLDVLKECSVKSDPGRARRSFTGAPDSTVPEAALADLLRGARLGGNGDAFLKGLGPVYAATLDERGQTLLVARREYTATLRDTSTGRQTGPAFPPADLAASEAFLFGPDGRTFVAIPGRAIEVGKKKAATARIWDANSGRPIGDLLVHPEAVRKVSFAPGGRILLTLCFDGSAWLWDTTDGHRIRRVPSSDAMIQDALFSPDGKALLTLEKEAPEKEDVLCFRVAETGEPKGKRIPFQGDLLSAVSFSSDGAYVVTRSQVKSVVARDETSGDPNVGDVEEMKVIVVVREGRTGEPVGSEFQKRGPFRDASFPRNSQTVLAAAVGRQAILWDLATNRQIGGPYEMDKTIDLVRISPDGKTVLACDGQTTQLWSTSGRRSVTLRPSGEFVFSPDGRKVFLIETKGEIGRESLVGTIWDTEIGKQVGSEFGLPLIYRGAIWAPSGESLLPFGEGSLDLRDVGTGQAIASLYPKRTARWTVDYDSNGEHDPSSFQEDSIYPSLHDFRLFRFATDGGLILGVDEYSTPPTAYSWAWNATTRTDVNLGWLPQERSLAVGYSPEGKTAFTTSFTEVVRAWDLKSGLPVGEPLPHEFRVWSVDLSPDGRTILTGGADKSARLWDRTGGTTPAKLDHNGAVFAVAFSHDGRRILTGSGDKNARLWDVESRKETTHGPFAHDHAPFHVAFEGVDAVRTISRDGTRVWELSGGPGRKETERLIPEWRQTRSRDGREVRRDDLMLDGAVEVFDAKGKRIGKPFQHPNASILERGMGGAISPDGKTLLTGDGAGDAYVWDVDSGKMRFPLPKSTEVKDIAFLDDSKAITAHADGSVVIWDVRSDGPADHRYGETLAHSSPITCIAIGPGGKTLLTGGSDKFVRVWDLRTRLLVGQPLQLDGTVRDIGVDPGNGHPVIVAYDETHKKWEWPFPAPWDEDREHSERIGAVEGVSLLLHPRQ